MVFTASLQLRGGCGHSLFPQSSKVFCFTNALRQFTLPTSGGGRGKKMFLILQRANQNIPYYVCDASNPWCGPEFSLSPKNQRVTRSIYSTHKATSRLIRRTFLSFSPVFPLFHFLASRSRLCFSNVCAAEDKSKALFY